jgi:hypothetical protein
MTSATIELYKALVSAGVDEDRARQVAEDVVTKDDAKHFATRADAAELRSELSRLEVRFYRALAIADGHHHWCRCRLAAAALSQRHKKSAVENGSIKAAEALKRRKSDIVRAVSQVWRRPMSGNVKQTTPL